ncbi:MAG: hypothetical protein Hyperionvirus3_23 [Hyperionvirus sp.]|uniref:Uncharacterized protein n=1 Tax=Hyperionvirus sp. TaxID=2487770 RepID=A0A3G5A6K2_9VIRU|nr:MAG: hypothetical protein Hyperionvirus3_23 [Hyperionvirus sp.]
MAQAQLQPAPVRDFKDLESFVDSKNDTDKENLIKALNLVRNSVENIMYDWKYYCITKKNFIPVMGSISGAGFGIFGYYGYYFAIAILAIITFRICIDYQQYKYLERGLRKWSLTLPNLTNAIANVKNDDLVAYKKIYPNMQYIYECFTKRLKPPQHLTDVIHSHFHVITILGKLLNND